MMQGLHEVCRSRRWPPRPSRSGRYGALAALCACVALLGNGAAAAAPAEVTATLVRAIDRLLNVEPDRAAAEARALQQIPGGEAAGAFVAAFIPLVRVAEKEDVAAEADQFLAALAPVLDRVRALEAEHPRDAEVKLLAGMVWGSKAMADGVRRNILAGYQASKESHRAFSEAVALQSDLYDAYYGLGLYDISFAQLPRVLRAAASVILPSGDLQRGLERLRLAAERGTYTRPLAQMALFRHLVGVEQRYAEAAAVGQSLVDRYPNNPDLYFPLALSYSEMGRHEEALRLARRVGARIDAGTPPFTREMLPRYYQLMGKLYMDMGEHATALRFFQRTIDHGNKAYAWVAAWAHTRSGMIYDLHGDRQEAIRHYRRALEVETESLAREAAQGYLATPYTGNAARTRRPRS